MNLTFIEIDIALLPRLKSIFQTFPGGAMLDIRKVDHSQFGWWNPAVPVGPAAYRIRSAGF